MCYPILLFLHVFWCNRPLAALHWSVEPPLLHCRCVLNDLYSIARYMHDGSTSTTTSHTMCYCEIISPSVLRSLHLRVHQCASKCLSHQMSLALAVCVCSETLVAMRARYHQLLSLKSTVINVFRSLKRSIPEIVASGHARHLRAFRHLKLFTGRHL